MTGEQSAAVAYFALDDAQGFLRKFIHQLRCMNIDEPFTKEQYFAMRKTAEDLHNAIGDLRLEFSEGAPI